MLNKVKLSIVIVTYNRPNEVLRAIESCFTEHIDNCEYVIWDNNSEETCKIVIQEYCNNAIHPIRYYYSKKNLGAGGGKNAAWCKCRGEYVFILDDDAVIYTDKYFVKLIQYMDTHKNVGAAYTNIYEPETKKYYDCKYQLRNRNNEIETLVFVGGAHIVRKNAIMQKNLYPSKSTFGSEETYASIMIWNNGYEVHKLQDLYVHHLPTAINRYLGKKRDKMFILSAYIMKMLLYPRILIPVSYVLFRVHLLKNNIPYDKECKDIISNTYYKEDVCRVKIKCIGMLVKKYGIKPLL